MTLLLPVRRRGPHYPDAEQTVSTELCRSEGLNAKIWVILSVLQKAIGQPGSISMPSHDLTVNPVAL